MNEAKFSANVRANLRGYDVQITARSDGDEDLLEILVAMVQQLDAIGATPERRWENGKPVNGNGQALEKPHQAAPAPEASGTVRPADTPAPQPALQAQPAPKPAPRPQAARPICDDCGTDQAMELIRWKDKETGKPRSAWKCQQCQNWLREPR